MRQIKVLSVDPERVQRHLPNWTEYGPVEVIPGVPGDIGLAHQRLARWALGEQWDESVVCLQDDVVILGQLPQPLGIVTAYGSRKFPSHVCPHAFSATAEGWGLLYQWWSKGSPMGVCSLWKPDVEFTGIVEEIL